MKFVRLRTENFMPNHPEISINTLTDPIAIDSIKVLVQALTGEIKISFFEGAPNDQKSACSTSIKNMARILKSSKLDSLGPLAIEGIEDLEDTDDIWLKFFKCLFQFRVILAVADGDTDIMLI